MRFQTLFVRARAVLALVLLASSCATPAAAPPSSVPNQASLTIPPVNSPMGTVSGPIIVYQDRTALYALDVSALPAVSRRLGPATDQPDLGTPLHGNGSLIAFPSGSDAVSLFSRAHGYQPAALPYQGSLRAVAVAQDGRIAIATTDDDNWLTADFMLAGKDGWSRINRIQTSSDAGGGELNLFWSGARTMTVIDVCHCDGGSGSATSYAIGDDGRKRVHMFLEQRVPYDAGVRMGTAEMVFNGIPDVDCFESEEACTNLTYSLVVADSERQTLRSIASRQSIRFDSPRMSPNGLMVAAGAWGTGRLEIYDANDGSMMAADSFTDGSVVPVEWVDERSLLAMIRPKDNGSDDQAATLELVTVDPAGRLTRRSLASGPYLTVFGWLR